MIRAEKSIVRLAAILFLVMTASACRHTPDEVQVRDAVASIAQAAEAGSAGDVVAPLTEDFDGNAGAMDQRQLAGMVRLLTLRGEHVGVTMGPVSIEHRGERMLARFTVTLTSGSKLLPDRAGVYQVESAWRKDDGDWRCYTASWTHTM